MGFLEDLFKTKDQRTAEQRTLMRKRQRELDKAASQVHNQAVSLKQKCTARRKDAYDLLKAGNRRQAESKMAELRTFEILLNKQEKKCWLLDYYKTQVEIAEADNVFVEAVAGLIKTVKIEPVKMEQMFANFDKVLDEKTDIDALFNAAYQEQTEKGSVSISADVPPLTEMMKELESEVALEVGGGKVAVASDHGANVASVREELDKLRTQGGQT